jgi:hypothetical protein
MSGGLIVITASRGKQQHQPSALVIAQWRRGVDDAADVLLEPLRLEPTA